MDLARSSLPRRLGVRPLIACLALFSSFVQGEMFAQTAPAPVTTTFPFPSFRQQLTLYTGGGAYRTFQIQVQSFHSFYFGPFINVACVGGGLYAAASGATGIDSGVRTYTVFNQCPASRAESLQFEVGPAAPSAGSGGLITVTAFPKFP